MLRASPTGACKRVLGHLPQRIGRALDDDRRADRADVRAEMEPGVRAAPYLRMRLPEGVQAEMSQFVAAVRGEKDRPARRIGDHRAERLQPADEPATAL